MTEPLTGIYLSNYLKLRDVYEVKNNMMASQINDFAFDI